MSGSLAPPSKLRDSRQGGSPALGVTSPLESRGDDSLAGLFREPQATWWKQASPGTSYWRCQVPAKRLPGQVLELTPKDICRDGKGYAFPRQSGAAVWQFPGNTTRALMMAGMQQAGVPVFLEVDDNYLVPFPLPHTQWKDRIGKDRLNEVSREAHKRIVPWVDGVLVATDELAEHYSRLNGNVHVCPNSIEVLDWEEPAKEDDDIFRIGYAASDSHARDIRLIEQAFDWASRQDGVEVVLFGLRPETGYWARIPVNHVPWTDTLDAYRASLSLIDIGVCPLHPGTWADCKSDIKAMEYVMAGAMPVVSKTTPYSPWFERCPVAEREKDWLKIVKWAVQNRDEVKRIAAEAKDYILRERTIAHTIGTWRAAFASVS